MYEDFAIRLVAGAAGGALLGLKGFFEVYKKGVKFDGMFFLKSLILPIIVGFGAGFMAADPKDAFIGGFMGKALSELYSTYKK